jgi:small subunit ribosomal protein S20
LANHKSAAKRARQSVRKNAVNSQRKSSVRTHEKNLLKALSEKKVKEVPEFLKSYMSQMAKAAQKGVFKKETASRKIARISARVSEFLTSQK